MATSTYGLIMIKDIYFQKEAWGDVALQCSGQVHHFSNLISLIGFIQNEYGSEFNLIEVTDENWQELNEQGIFNEQ